MDWNTIFSLFQRKPEFENLEKYIEGERLRRVDPAREKAYATAFGLMVLGALGAFGFALIMRSFLLGAALFVLVAAFSVSSLVSYNRRLTEEEKQLSQKRREARLFVHQLWIWKHSRKLKKELGAGIGELLDAAATYWLRTQAALNSEGFRLAEPGSNWAGARDRIQQAIESAMTQVLLIARESAGMGTDFLTPGFDRARSMVEEMREMAKETERLGDRLRIRDTGQMADSPTEELRRTLEDLRRLEEAEEEIDRLSQSG